MNKKISVVMSTFNGEKYIVEQLDSILLQTKKPDEVIIIDDKSTDGTFETIRKFINDKKLSNWKCFKNTVNKGWRKNFIDALQLASGDIVFLSDQDDIWDSKKIEKMSYLMEDNCKIKVLGCNLHPFFEKGVSKKNVIKAKREKKQRINDSTVVKQLFSNGVSTRRQGCATCFDRELIPYIGRIWFDNYSHDGTIWALGIILDSAYVFNESLVHFRRHESNNTPSNNRSKNNRIKLLLNESKLLLNILKNKSFLRLSDEQVSMISDKIRFNSTRIDAIQNNKIRSLFLLLRGKKYGYKFLNFLADICCLLVKRSSNNA